MTRTLRTCLTIASGALASAFLLIYAVGRLSPEPWWRGEAGFPSSPLADMAAHGTGFFVNDRGWLLTNRHVVASCSRVTVGNGQLSGVVVDAVRLPADPQLDLAALHVPLSPSQWLSLASAKWPVPPASGEVKVEDVQQDVVAALAAEGQRVTVVGYPGADRTASPARIQGELLPDASSVDRRFWYQKIRTSVRPGASGSPVIDERGETIGVIFSAILNLPGSAPAEKARSLEASLLTSATEGEIVPAAVADDFLESIGREAAPGPRRILEDPNVAIVRVFCFR